MKDVDEVVISPTWWWSIPAIGLLPLLQAPLPLQYHPQREGAGYFQALAVTRLGIDSLYVVTPDESISGLHLHSILSAPLVELGYAEGGRLVSWLAAIAACLVVARLGYRLVGKPGAVLAPIFLWLQPLFVRQGFAFMPETLSILLTSVAVLSTLKYLDTENNIFLLITVVAITLSITNHLWELVIVGPATVILLVERHQLEALLIGSVSFISALIVRWASKVQFDGVPPTNKFLLPQAGPEFLALNWWTRFFSLKPFDLAFTLTLPLAIVALCYWSYHWYRDRTVAALLLSTWLLSGVAIPLGFPGGFPWHRYYLWNLLAPMALTGAYLSEGAIRIATTRFTWFDKDQLLRGVAIVVVSLALLNIVVFEIGALAAFPPATAWEAPATREAAVDAGLSIRDCDVESDRQITFVWDRPKIGVFWTPTGTILIYSDTLVTTRLIRQEGGGGPRFVQERSRVSTDVAVLERDDGYEVIC